MTESNDTIDGRMATLVQYALEAAGANKQRPLWASTGVKDPAYDDTRYVVDLVAPNTVNTAPERPSLHKASTDDLS